MRWVASSTRMPSSARELGAVFPARGVGIVFLPQVQPFLVALILRPLDGGRFLDISRGDDPGRFLEPGWLQSRRHRTRSAREVLARLPADIVGLADGLRGEFRRADVE